MRERSGLLPGGVASSPPGPPFHGPALWAAPGRGPDHFLDLTKRIAGGDAADDNMLGLLTPEEYNEKYGEEE